MGNGADWGTTGQRTGYKVSSTPKAGDVISFKQGVAGYHPLYGHVAFVEAVGEDSILISEGDISYLNYRIIPNEIALSSGVSYITPK
jgi:surface antigen